MIFDRRNVYDIDVRPDGEKCKAGMLLPDLVSMTRPQIT
jgi:hypothetical protein